MSTIAGKEELAQIIRAFRTLFVKWAETVSAQEAEAARGPSLATRAPTMNRGADLALEPFLKAARQGGPLPAPGRVNRERLAPSHMTVAAGTATRPSRTLKGVVRAEVAVGAAAATLSPAMIAGTDTSSNSRSIR